MTYLEMVNAVLVRLRETQVTSITDGTEGPLIAALVADAYKIVEDAHDWTRLRSTETVATVADTETVTLTDVTVDSKVYHAYISGERELKNVSKEWLMRRDLFSASNTGTPTHYSIQAAGDDLVVTLYPTPDAVYSIKFDVAKRGTAPTVDGSVLQVPTDAVLHLACALATRERGETGGTSAAEYFRMSELALADAIARDANHRPDELALYAP